MNGAGAVVGNVSRLDRPLPWPQPTSEPVDFHRFACEPGRGPAALRDSAGQVRWFVPAYRVNNRGEMVSEVSSTAIVWSPGVAAPGETLLADGNIGRCLDVLRESREPGAGLTIDDCHGGANQRSDARSPGDGAATRAAR